MLRGHNLPGGGFIGGLIAAAAFAFYVIAYDTSVAKSKLRVDPIWLIATGLVLSLISTLPSILLGKAAMTALWDGAIPLHWLGLGALKIGTPLLFDMGVYLVVIGVTLLIIFTLGEED
jgi:multicomponent Na+:H+ antiporter subunit B